MLYYDLETQKRYGRIALFSIIGAVFLLVALGFASKYPTASSDGGQMASSQTDEPSLQEEPSFDSDKKESDDDNVEPIPSQPVKELFQILSVTDGDTFRIDYYGVNTPVRIIGVDTPETVDSRTVVQCFGQEASSYLKAKLTGKSVVIEADSTQSDRDKYDRLLRYVYLDGEDIGLSIIKNGYGHEYTYNIPYQKQSEYKSAEKYAENNNLGLWSPSTCNGNTTQSATPTPAPATTPTPAPTPTTTPTPQPTTCLIKGNISSKGEKIYHVPGQRYYDKTIIDTSKGERMFCTEEEAVRAGWRKSKV